MFKLSKKTYSIRLTIFTLFSIVVGMVTILLLTLQHYYAKEITINATETLFSKASQTMDDQAVDMELRVIDAIETIRRHQRMSQRPRVGDSHPLLPTFEAILRQNDTFYGIYVGHDTGEFHGLFNLTISNTLRERLDAPKNAIWAVMTMIKTIDGEWTLIWEFFDKYMNEAGDLIEGEPFDLFRQPWYQQAIQQEELVQTKPYILDAPKMPGITYAKYQPRHGVVVGVDVTSKLLAQLLSKEKITQHSEALLLNSDEKIIAHENLSKIISEKNGVWDLKSLEELSLPNLAEIRSMLKASGRQMAILKSPDGNLLTMKSDFDKGLKGEWKLITFTPLDELMQPFIEKEQETVLWTLVLVLLILGPIAHISASKIANPVKALVQESKKIEALEFDEVGRITSNITEIQSLSRSVIKSAHALTNMTESLDFERNKLEKLIQTGLSLSAEKDEDALFELILFSAQELTNADGGTLYIKNEDQLNFEIIRNDSMNILMGGKSSDKPSFPPVMLVNPDTGEENLKNIASVTALKSKTIIVDDVYTNEEYDFQGPKRFDAANNYHSKSFLTVPLTSRHGGVIGVIQLVNAMDSKTGKAVEFDPAVVPFVEALCAQAGVALENRQLLRAQIDLLDSLIKLIAGAIDAKSPYTGGHCERVPKLAEMLTKAASEEEEGLFAEFRLESEDQWRELQIGAWLHDCGKVTTPEYIVDKATKLETIYNRIHEVRMRFEVMWRDAEIEYWQKRTEGAADIEILQKELTEKQIQIRDDFEFVARCNVGGEFMEDADKERLRKIADQHWQRNLPDDLGLSHTELERMELHPRPALPTTEKLLADNPWHIIPRGPKDHIDAEKFGFKMDIPENLYNLGEVYNLCISRGTLTEEDRFKINEHVIQTIKMLDALPLPKNMSRVPEYAGTHHETLVGTGYPCKLTGEDLSTPARIMAIADIFEALTASDRPYKKAKKLSEAIKILSFMAKDKHIDTDLFELFLKKGLHIEYAQQFLLEEQIDEVDITKYIRSEVA